MHRIFRVAQGGDTFHAIEADGVLRRAVLRGSDLFGGYDPGGEVSGGLSAVTLLAPVRPSKMVCVGLNYRDHAEEMKKALPPEPLVFLKPSTTVNDPGAAILLPPGVGRVDYEA